MRLAAVFLAITGFAYACEREEQLVPIAIAFTVALVVLAIVAMQLRDERAGEGARTAPAPTLPTPAPLRRAAPANDNASPEERAS